MTLFDLIFFVTMILIGVGLAKVLYPIGGFWLGIPGFVAGVLLIPSMFFAYNRYRRWAYLGDKWMPDCSCGSAKYKVEKVGEEYHHVCQGCRTSYEKCRDQVSVFENGVKKPYKRLVKHQGWI